MNRMWMAVCIIAIFAVGNARGGDASAEEILKATGVTGGLVVHIHCGDGKLTAALRAGESYVVHGLTTDLTKVAGIRESIRKAGLNGPVAVDAFDGKHLPYAENLVNLLVSENLSNVSMDEIMRTLAPRGVAYVKTGGAWKKTVKPVPDNIDDWPHYLHGADNNAVAQDTVAGPAYRTQWVGGPSFARSHEITSSMAAMVSATGRIFYIWDENPTGMTDKRFPANWKVIARDAFNGIVLWKRTLPKWGWREWHAASRWKDPRERAKMLRLTPVTATRRLVASGDRVFVTLGYRAPVSILNAATGDIVQEIEGTALTDEILHADGRLILRVRTPESPPEKDVWNSLPDKTMARVMVVDAKSGKKQWESKPEAIPPMTLAVRDGRVFYCDYERIVCLNLDDGKEIWRSQPVAGNTGNRGTIGTLVAHDKVVLLKPYNTKGKKDSGRLVALSAESGKLLWTGPKYVGPGIANPPDLFVVSGLVWICETKMPVTHTQVELKRQGFDPLTGKVVREVVVPKLISWGHHYRCYRSKATERFLMLPKRGIEFVDLKGKDHMRHDWLRPPCIFGAMPANGLVYVPPHQCVCYQGVLLSNFNALAPKGKEDSAPLAPTTRLHKGPAWGEVEADTQTPKEEWPTYRRDAKRCGTVATQVPGMAEKWQAKLTGPLTPPVVAGGRVMVAERETHTLHALNANTGQPVWHFTAGGRVDSPPTVYKGMVLFGSADGRVYCLRLQDGQEVWRFMAAPRDLRVTSYGQLESAWPVHGNVLVQKDVAYVTAGRSSFLDGGVYLYGLDPKTGKVVHQNRLDGPRKDPFKVQGGAGYMDGAKSDILVSDGSDIYLFQERFDAKLKRHPSPMLKPEKERGGFRVYPPAQSRGSSAKRLITTHGFLVDVDNEGKYWTYGDRWPGWSRKMGGMVYGQLLVFDQKTLYGVHVFTENVRVRRGRDLGGKGPRIFARDHDAKKDNWSVNIPVRVRAMVLAGKKLYLAGPPDIVPTEDPLAAIEGRRGARLLAISAADGKKLSEVKLDAPPVFDGLIAANECLYVNTEDGTVRCLGK